jgi:hypothetical protein
MSIVKGMESGEGRVDPTLTPFLFHQIARTTVLAFVLGLVLFGMCRFSRGDPAQSDDLFHAYTSAPGGGPQIKWQGAISIDATMPTTRFSGAEITLTQRDIADDFIQGYGFQYAVKLTHPAGIEPHFELDRSRMTFAIKSADEVTPVSFGESLSGKTFGVMRVSDDNRPLCSLIVEWRGAFIRTAAINVRVSASRSEVVRCINELVWRSFGFLGDMGEPTTWLDQTLTEDQKIKLLKRLYETGQQ